MTPAVNILKRAKIKFTVHGYSHRLSTGNYGKEAAEQLNVAFERVFKTLVAAAENGSLHVGLVPVSGQLNLKAFARFTKTKKLKMADRLLVEKFTGYLPGGVSPLGQKKKLPTVIDRSALQFDTIFVSAGKRGSQIELAPEDLAELAGARFEDIAGS